VNIFIMIYFAQAQNNNNGHNPERCPICVNCLGSEVCGDISFLIKTVIHLTVNLSFKRNF